LNDRKSGRFHRKNPNKLQNRAGSARAAHGSALAVAPQTPMRVTRSLLFVSALPALDVNAALAHTEPASTQDIQNSCASPGLSARMIAHHRAEHPGAVAGSADTAWE
jgi:hypothetical protein